ncbi:hypothetical protein [Saccharomonospora sp. CUA-673]|nr:hypothetical protein [Saccharomonospora sp. CUA-673]
MLFGKAVEEFARFEGGHQLGLSAGHAEALTDRSTAFAPLR